MPENIFRRTQGWRWLPDADAVNAPDGALLRADNTIPDRLGARSLRMGSNQIYTGLQEQRVHTLYTPTLQSVVYRMAGIDNQVYRQVYHLDDTQTFESFGVPFDGDGEDISFGDDFYQVFMARKQTKKKFDGVSFHNWGIKAPTKKATTIAVDAITSVIATFDDSESPALVTNEGTGAFVDDYANNATSALALTPDAATGRASCTKMWPADQDLLDIAGSAGGPTDLFDIRVWLEDPRKVDKVTIMFGLSTGADAFLDDFYYFTFNIRNDGKADTKDADAGSSAAYDITNQRLLDGLNPEEITDLKSPEEAAVVLKRLGASVGPQSTERPDAIGASPAWGHFAVMRQQFIRVGQTPRRDWKTVRGFKVVYTVVPGATEKIYLDDAIWTGGGNRALTGTFRVGYRFARRFKDNNGNVIYTELSPMSPISDKLVLRQQTAQITIPAISLSGADPQVDTVWVYMYGGWLDTYYRFAEVSSEINQGMTIDELTNPSGGDFERAEDRSRLTSHGFSLPRSEGGNQDLIFTIRKSELEALVENEVFEPGAVGPPDRIIGIAGPQNKRMFVLTEEGWIYPSTIKSPSGFSLYHAIDGRMYGTPYWIVKTASGTYAGFSKDIIRISGDGTESANHIFANLYAEALKVANPPVDSMITQDGNAIIYRSADGLMLFNGTSSIPLPMAGTSLLWKGEARHGVDALNRSTGRFRMAVDDHNFFMLAPENPDTDPTSIWRFQNDPEMQWSRATYTKTYLSIYKEPDGSLLAGTTDGEIDELEIGDNDLGLTIPITVLTPISEGASPLTQKDPSDFQAHINTGGETAVFAFYKNGSSVNPRYLNVQTTNIPIVYRAQMDDLGAFLKIQVGISGSFNTFILNAINLQVVSRPQHMMVLDAGEVMPTNGSDLAWITQVEIDLQSDYDVILETYKNGSLHASQLITVNPGNRDVYTIPTIRGTKARRIGFKIRTTAPDGQGEVGFECFSLKARHAGTGNATDLVVGQGDSGNA